MCPRSLLAYLRVLQADDTAFINLGDAEIKGGAVGDVAADDDFLTRERAALGDDAAQFSTSIDHMHASTTVEDGEYDLLGGGSDFTSPGGGDTAQFESSFPAIDNRNEVSWFTSSWE